MLEATRWVSRQDRPVLSDKKPKQGYYVPLLAVKKSRQGFPFCLSSPTPPVWLAYIYANERSGGKSQDWDKFSKRYTDKLDWASLKMATRLWKRVSGFPGKRTLENALSYYVRKLNSDAYGINESFLIQNPNIVPVYIADF